MDTEKRELWDRLDGEPSRAYEAFQTFLRLPTGSRTVVEAYRRHVDNPQAKRVSDTWARWSNTFAWSPRAEAYDSHLDEIRQKGLEDAIYAEAKKQSRTQERMRGNLSEQLVNYHHKVMSFLEQSDVEGMRFSDAIAITRLYIEHVDKFGTGDEERSAAEWTEEDDEFLREAAERVKQRRMARENGGADVDEPNEDQEDSENPKNSPD